MMSVIIIPAVLIGILGLIFGVVLAFASKVFNVEIDPKIEQITAVLPGANCGACGQPGCAGYAESIVNSGVAISLCAPGGAEVVKKIADILGTTATETVKKVAVIHCNSGGYENTNLRYEYDGIESCLAACQIAHGPNACVYGCVYQNDCIEVCKFGAITLDANGIRVVNPELCGGCGACVQVCPRHLITLEQVSHKVQVMCSSRDKGPIARNNCGAKTACLACGLCAKNCPVSAIKVENNLAVIDYGVCTGCGVCVGKCPTKVIVCSL